LFNDFIAFFKKYVRFVSNRTSALKITRFALRCSCSISS